MDFSTSIFSVLYIFIHFSLTVMTTTGFGDIYARGVIARMFVLVQMLVSILYNAVIIGLGTSRLIDMQSAHAEQEFSRMKLKAAAAGSEHGDEEGDEDEEEVQLDEADEDDEEDGEDDPFDRAAAERRREERRLAGGDHIQLAIMHPPPPPVTPGRADVEGLDFSEDHMFGKTEPGMRREVEEEEEDGEADELDMHGGDAEHGDDGKADDPDSSLVQDERDTALGEPRSRPRVVV